MNRRAFLKLAAAALSGLLGRWPRRRTAPMMRLADGDTTLPFTLPATLAGAEEEQRVYLPVVGK